MRQCLLWVGLSLLAPLCGIAQGPNLQNILAPPGGFLVEGPKGGRAAYGKPYRLEVSCSDPNVRFQWETWVTDRWVSIADANQSVYEVSLRINEEQRHFRCLVTTDSHSVYTDEVSVVQPWPMEGHGPYYKGVWYNLAELPETKPCANGLFKIVDFNPKWKIDYDVITVEIEFPDNYVADLKHKTILYMTSPRGHRLFVGTNKVGYLQATLFEPDNDYIIPSRFRWKEELPAGTYRMNFPYFHSPVLSGAFRTSNPKSRYLSELAVLMPDEAHCRIRFD